MKLSIKKFSKKSLSLLIALIMVFSALPFSPLSSPIEANAAEVKTIIDVWDASRAGTNSNTGQYRYSYADSKTGKTLSGIQWGGLTHNSTYLTVSNSALSFAEISTIGAITGNDNIADLGIRGNKWSFSAKFAYRGSSTNTTVFGLASTTKRQYTRSNSGGDTVISNGYVADLVDIRANGTVYIGNNWTAVSGISSSDLVADSATSPKTLTVTYDNGNLTIDIDGTQKISKTVDTALFSAGVGNYLAGPNVQVFSGGTAPYYQVSNDSAYLYNMNLYSLSGATYQTTGGGEEPTAPTDKTISVIGYGILKNTGKDNRASSNVLGIVNDQQDANFDIGFVNFDISSLSNSEFNVASAMYNMTYSIDGNSSSGREAKGLSFYYATQNNSAFNLENKPANFTNTTYDSNIYRTNNQHIAKATSYLGLVNIGSVDTTVGATNASIPIDLAPAIKYALKKGETRFQLLIMLKEAGGAGGGPWTDTNVTVPTTPVPVTMQTYADYVSANINVEGKVNKNYSNIVENNAGAYTGNVIVADQWTASQNNTYYLEDNQKASDNFRFYAYNNAVALYTGAGNVRFPIVFEKVAVSNYSGYDVYQNIEYTALNNGGLFSLGNDNDQWQYCNSATDLTDATSGTGEGQVVSNFSNSTAASKDSYREDGDNINYAKNDKFGTTTTKAFKNYIKYIGSGNSDTYYDKLSTPTFSYRADYAVFYQGSWGYWYLSNVHDKGFTLNSDFTCYVLNYKPLYDIVSNASFKNNYNQISQNSSKYSQEGLNNYYAVVADIIDFNLANEPMTSESEVRAVAAKIKDLVKRYNDYKTPELKQYTVTFYELISGVPVKTLRVTPGTTINESDLPPLTTPKYNQNNQHYIYYWKNSDDTEFTVPYTVNENVDISESRRIENCKFAVKSISGNTSTVSCSVCNGGTYTLDIEAYNNTVSVAQEAINDTAKYDSASRANLQEVLNNNNTVNDCTTIEQINAKISAIQTAITALKLNQYSITVNYVDENSKDLGTDIITNVDYGTIEDVTANTTFDDKDYVVYKWTRSTQDGDKLLGLNSTSVSVNVIGNLTYYVHLKSTQAESSTDTAVVTLNNKAGKPVDVGYVTTNAAQDVVVNDNTIKIGTNTTLTAPQYSFYSIKGFIVNGELITAESGTKSITVTEDMSIIPLYSPTNYVNITRKSGETFTINGKDIDSYSAKWDELITLESTGDVIWCTTKNGSEVVLGQGASLKFRANEAIEIFTKQTGETLSPISRVGYFGYDADLKKVTIVNNFFVPGGTNENVKAGVVVSTKEKTRDELITQYNAGSLKFEGGYDKFTADKNQLRISINRSGSGDFSMWALSYVVVDGTPYFASEVSSYTYNSSTTA